MTTFFSGTDMQELHDNAGAHNYYLSLIVNHKSEFCAKIAITAQIDIPVRKSKYKFKGNNEEASYEFEDKAQQDNVLMLMDCIIEFEQSEFEIERYEAVKAKKGARYTAYNNVGAGTYTPVHNIGYNKNLQHKNQATAWGEYGHVGADKNYIKPNSKQVKLDIPNDLMGFDTPKKGVFPADDGVTSSDIDEISLRAFTVKWLCLDITANEFLTSTFLSLGKMPKGEFEQYLNNIDDNFDGFLKDDLGIETYDESDKICGRVIALLRPYSSYKYVSSILAMLTTNHLIYGKNIVGS